jgi:hypothetical protein
MARRPGQDSYLRLSESEGTLVFIPLIISTGGNSGSQSAAFVIRSLALGGLTLRDWRRVLVKEFSSGIVLGLFLGMVGFCRIILWQNLHLTDYGTHYLLIRPHSVAESHWRSAFRNGSRKHVASATSLGWL